MNCTWGWERPPASGWQSLQRVLYLLPGAHNSVFLPGTYQNSASISPRKSVTLLVIRYWQRPEERDVCEVLTCISLSTDLMKDRRDSERPRRAEKMRADGHQHKFPEVSEGPLSLRSPKFQHYSELCEPRRRTASGNPCLNFCLTPWRIMERLLF